jgi:DNA-binding transcriptional LysR family regulator
MVQEDLDNGRLVLLNIPEYKSGKYSFDVIYRTDLPPGPAARWLIDRFVQQSSA